MPQTEDGEDLYPDGMEYFHPDAMVDGTFIDNMGVGFEAALKTFYENVFGKRPKNADIYYNLHGALMNAGTDKGKFHNGIDMQGGAGSLIKSAHNGVITTKPSIGAVRIGSATNKCWYLHMNLSVSSGNIAKCDLANRNNSTTLGTEGSVGDGGAHLHFEYAKAPQLAILDSNTPMVSRNPYWGLLIQIFLSKSRKLLCERGWPIGRPRLLFIPAFI